MTHTFQELVAVLELVGMDLCDFSDLCCVPSDTLVFRSGIGVNLDWSLSFS